MLPVRARVDVTLPSGLFDVMFPARVRALVVAAILTPNARTVAVPSAVPELGSMAGATAPSAMAVDVPSTVAVAAAIGAAVAEAVDVPADDPTVSPSSRLIPRTVDVPAADPTAAAVLIPVADAVEVPAEVPAAWFVETPTPETVATPAPDAEDAAVEIAVAEAVAVPVAVPTPSCTPPIEGAWPRASTPRASKPSIEAPYIHTPTQPQFELLPDQETVSVCPVAVAVSTFSANAIAEGVVVFSSSSVALDQEEPDVFERPEPNNANPPLTAL